MAIGSVNYGERNPFPWGLPLPDPNNNVGTALMGTLAQIRQAADRQENDRAFAALSQARNQEEMRGALQGLQQQRAQRSWFSAFNPLAPSGYSTPAEQSAMGQLMQQSFRDPLDDEYRRAQIESMRALGDQRTAVTPSIIQKNEASAGASMASAQQRLTAAWRMGVLTDAEYELKMSQAERNQADANQTNTLTDPKKKEIESRTQENQAQTNATNDKNKRANELQPGIVEGQNSKNQGLKARTALLEEQTKKLIQEAQGGKPITDNQVYDIVAGYDKEIAQYEEKKNAADDKDGYDIIISKIKNDRQLVFDNVAAARKRQTVPVPQATPATTPAPATPAPDAQGMYKVSGLEEAQKLKAQGIPSNKIYW